LIAATAKIFLLGKKGDNSGVRFTVLRGLYYYLQDVKDEMNISRLCQEGIEMAAKKQESRKRRRGKPRHRV
jgi:hypothetical protein